MREKHAAAESIDSYVSRLCRLAKHCSFSNVDSEIKSQVVQHCVLSKVKEKAFMESCIALMDLLTYARSVEATLSSVAAMTGISSSTSASFSKESTMHKVEHSSSSRKPRPTYASSKSAASSSASGTHSKSRRCGGQARARRWARGHVHPQKFSI